MRHDTPTPRSSIKRTLSTLLTQRYPSSEYKAIFETVLIGSFILVAVLMVLLFVSYFALNNTHVIGRIFVCAAALLYLAATYGAWMRGRYVIASQLLVLFYYTIAALVMFGWGAGITFSHLMFAITIVLAGTLLGSRAVIVTAALAIATMFLAQIATVAQVAPWFDEASTATIGLGDTFGFAAMLMVLALISALFSRQTQAMHAEDQQAKARLVKEKGSLELSVQKHSEQLKTLQLEEMEQLYKFAEIGQLSAVLMHDIAGHLTALNMDIADLKRDKRHGTAVKHVEESIEYIEEIIGQARHHLQIRDAAHRFDVLECINDCIALPRFQKARPHIKVVAPKNRIFLFGEPLRLSHTLVVLIRNALESYAENTPPADRSVKLILSEAHGIVTIKVSDHGAGISEEARKKLFLPLRSAKKNGLGIGLFIAKKITETHFNGMLQVDPDATHTTFILSIPKHNA